VLFDFAAAEIVAGSDASPRVPNLDDPQRLPGTVSLFQTVAFRIPDMMLALSGLD
jgi:hypothetical protein